MTNIFTLRTAGILIGVSALLHLVAILFKGFGASMVPMLVTAAIMGIFALGLMRSMRWLGYLAFIGLLIGMVIAFGQSYSDDIIPNWLHLINAALNLAAVIILFVCLWRNKTAIA